MASARTGYLTSGVSCIEGKLPGMSLYFEAASILTPQEGQVGSLKTRVFSNKGLKSPPAQVYALVSEASRWSLILSEVIERSQILQLEHKVRSHFL